MKKLTRILEITTITLLILTIASVFINVVMRYVFNNSLLAIQELEWHFFSALFLLSMSYATLKNAHVRVDVLYQNFSSHTQYWINLLGIIIFIIPISGVIAYDAYFFAYDAYLLGEKSPDPGGLSYRFIIKSIIPISFILLIITNIYQAYQISLALYQHKKNNLNYSHHKDIL